MNIYISYTMEDRKFEEKLEADLRNNDIQIQSIASKILPGEVISERIVNEITNADCFIIILSQNSLKSSWVITELNLAISAFLKGDLKSIIPVILDKDVKIPSLLESIQYADFTKPSDYPKALHTLIASIKHSLNVTPDQKLEGQKRQWEYINAARLGLEAEKQKYKIQQAQRNYRIFFIASIAISLLGLLIIGIMAAMLGNESTRLWLIAELLLYTGLLIILVIFTARMVKRKQNKKNIENHKL